MGHMVYLKAVMAFLLVIALIGALGVLLRWIVQHRSTWQRKLLGLQAHKQLSIAEVLYIDSKRRLVLIKDGNQKHLILLGPHGDCLITSTSSSTV